MAKYRVLKGAVMVGYKSFTPDMVFDSEGISEDVLAELRRDGKAVEMPANAHVISAATTASTIAASPWTLDPAKLKGKTIKELNAMLLERDKSVHPYKKIEDAIAHLSNDFTG